MQPGFLNIQRLEFRIRGEDAGNLGDLRPAGEIVIAGECNQDQEASENIEFSASRHSSGPKKSVQLEFQAETSRGYGSDLHAIQKIKILRTFDPVYELDHRGIIGVQCGGH